MGEATAELYPAKMSNLKGQRQACEPEWFPAVEPFPARFCRCATVCCEATSTSYSAKVLPWLSKLSSSATPLPVKLICFDEPLTRYALAAVSYSQRGSGWVRFGL
jgi:hypothetical protein